MAYGPPVPHSDDAPDNGVADLVFRGGRPRDPSRDAAIKKGAVQVLADVGYHRLTMDAVAAAAGVGKATIYRRWASKEDLLVSIIDAASDAPLGNVPDTGSLSEDLRSLLTSLARVLAGPGGLVSRALLGVLDAHPALADAYRRGPLARWAEVFAEVFDRAVRRGEVTPGAGTSLAAEAGPALLVQRWLVTGDEIDGDLVDAVVDEVMMPLLEAGEASEPRREPPGSAR